MHNLFLLLGTIIGAGIFSLPIALAKTGFLVFFPFALALGYLLGKTNTLYREIVESTRERHQLPGYVKRLLGNKLSFVSVICLLFSTLGALLAYLILSGEFIAKIVPVSPAIGSWIFYAVVFVMLFFGGRNLEILDIFMTIVKVILLAAVILITFSPSAFYESLTFVPSNFSIKAIFLAYGSDLFALTGFSIVPELKKDKGINSSIWAAQGISVLIYVLFALNVRGFVNGESFSLPGLVTTALFNLAGVFGVLTPYLMLSWVSYDLLDKDLGFPKKEALILTLVVPLLLFLIGLNDFMAVISVSGGVFLGAIAILIARMYETKFPGKHTLLIRIIEIVFAVGGLVEIISLI